METAMKESEYIIRCRVHTYITFEYDGKFLFCLDTDMMYAEKMIYKIKKRTNLVETASAVIAGRQPVI